MNLLVSSDFFLFILNSSIVILSYFVINNKNLINAILILILLIINISIISFFLNAQFLSLLFIIIYVGAVLVLFLFTIMLLGYKEDQKFDKKKFLFFIFFFFLILYFFYNILNINGILNINFLLEQTNLRTLKNKIIPEYLEIYHLHYFENIDKMGYFIFIQNPKIIIYSTIILLLGMIASINISKLNTIFLKNQQKEVQMKRKIKESLTLILI